MDDFLSGVDTIYLIGLIGLITPILTDWLIRLAKLKEEKAKVIAPVIVSGLVGAALVLYREPSVQGVISPYVQYGSMIFGVSQLVYRLAYKQSEIRTTLTGMESTPDSAIEDFNTGVDQDPNIPHA